MRNGSPILIEGFLLQARNIHLFIPVFLVAVAYTALSAYGYSTVVRPLLAEVFHHAQQLWFRGYYEPLWLWSRPADLLAQARISAGHLAAASTGYLLITAFTVGPAVLVVTVSAAVVTACSGDRRSPPSFHALVRNLLTAGLNKRGPFGTALLGHVVHAVACRGAILIFELLTAFSLRYYKRDLAVEFLVFLLGHVIALYVEVVCTLAVVVSAAAAEPAGCIYGVRALRQAWWVVKEKTSPAVILVFVKAVFTAVLEAISIRVYIFPIHYYYNLTMAYAVVPGFVCITLYAALQLWFVCATTLYYYQCRQRTDD